MSHSVIKIRGEDLYLLKEKAIYWPRQKTIILADLHIGKVSHFRKSGIPIPTKAIKANWSKFAKIVTMFPTDRIIILGDLFHSEINMEWTLFENLISSLDHIRIDLVLGNHDIIDQQHYLKAGMHVHELYMKDTPFLFVHDEEDIEREIEDYILCGHIHPGVRVSAPGMRPLRVPCFHFNSRRGILPAFGNFTGFILVEQKKGDEIHLVSDKKVVKWP